MQKSLCEIIRSYGLNTVSEIVDRDVHSMINLDERDSAGNTPLHVLCNLIIGGNQGDFNQQSNTILEIFLKSFPPDAQNNNGETALMLACSVARKNLCEILLKANASISLKDNKQHTALWFACYFDSGKINDRISCVEILLRDPKMTYDIIQEVTCDEKFGMLGGSIKKTLEAKKAEKLKVFKAVKDLFSLDIDNVKGNSDFVMKVSALIQLSDEKIMENHFLLLDSEKESPIKERRVNGNLELLKKLGYTSVNLHQIILSNKKEWEEKRKSLKQFVILFVPIMNLRRSWKLCAEQE